MSVTIKIDNFTTTNIKESAMLNSDAPAGATSITTTNSQNLKPGEPIIVGRLGSETAEMSAVVTQDSATIVTTAPLKLAHSAYEDVTVLVGNKLKIYRAPNTNDLQPEDIYYQLIDAPIDIDADQLSTTFIDPEGGAGFWYKFTYYNSISGAETNIADSASSRGGGVGNYTNLDSIRTAAGFKKNRNISDAYIAQFRKNAQDRVNAALSGIYILPFTTVPVNGMIVQITTALAAGYLLIDQHGSFTTSSTTNGQLKIDWAEKQLNLIRSGEVTLTDSAGTVLPQPGGGGGSPGGGLGFSGYPNDAEQGGGFKFTSDMRY